MDQLPLRVVRKGTWPVSAHRRIFGCSCVVVKGGKYQSFPQYLSRAKGEHTQSWAYVVAFAGLGNRRASRFVMLRSWRQGFSEVVE